MQRWRIDLAYNGEKFHGWQVQPNAVSVQEILEKALSEYFNETVNIVGCGRTDTGVHAGCYTAHFDTTATIEEFQSIPEVTALNQLINNDISIFSIQPVAADFHARFDAAFRVYHYYVTTQKEPLLRHFSYYIFGDIDFDLMNRAAKILYEYVDFTSFSKLHTQTKTNNCHIEKAEWRYENGLWVFEIKADRFLRNMVRAIIGTLLEVGRHKMTLEGFRNVIEQKDRNDAGVSVPAHALFLHDVGYAAE